MAKEQLQSPQTIAKLFNFEGTRRIDQLVQDGVITPTIITENGRKVRKYDLLPTIMKYIKHLQDKLAKKTAPEEASDDEIRKLKAEADLKEAKAAIEQLKKKEFEGMMHRSEDVEAITTDLIMAVRAELLALPGTLAVDVAAAQSAAEASGIIKEAVNTILNSLSEYKYDPKKYAKLVREREKWMNEQEKQHEQEEETE